MASSQQVDLTGAVLGPIAANGLVPIFGGKNLLLIAALVFMAAAALSVWLRHVATGPASNGNGSDAPPTLRTLLSGQNAFCAIATCSASPRTC